MFNERNCLNIIAPLRGACYELRIAILPIFHASGVFYDVPIFNVAPEGQDVGRKLKTQNDNSTPAGWDIIVEF